MGGARGITSTQHHRDARVLTYIPSYQQDSSAVLTHTLYTPAEAVRVFACGGYCCSLYDVTMAFFPLSIVPV